MMFGFGRNLLSDLGCSLVRGAASSPLATVTLARGFSSTSTFWHMRDFWAKPTGSMHKYPGHRQRKPIVFKRAKLWLKNCGKERTSYIPVRKIYSFDSLMKFETGRKRLMHRIMRGDKKIAEF